MTVLSSGNVGIGTATPGSTLDVKGTLRLSGATSGYVGFAPQAAAGSTTYVLPAADGSPGNALVTDGSGNLSWTSPSSGSVTSVTAGTGLNVGAGPGGSITSTGTLNINVGTGASQIMQLTAASKIPAVDGSLVTNLDPTHLSAAVPINKGGTNSVAALSNNRIMSSVGGAIVEAAAVTASRALISDANGIPTHSSVTSTELGYVSGVTSAIQTQINTKASSTGWTNYSAMSVNGSGALTAVAGSTSGSHLNWTVTGPAWTTASFPSSTTANQLLYSSADNVVGGLTTANNSVLTTNGSGVPSWNTLASDVFSQYALLAGRSGGQTLTGGTAASNNLTLDSTSHATKGFVLLNPTGGTVGIGTTAPPWQLTVSGTSASLAVVRYGAAAYPGLKLISSGGTEGSETAIGALRGLGAIQFGGYDGASYNNSPAMIAAASTEAFSATAHGSAITFFDYGQYNCHPLRKNAY